MYLSWGLPIGYPAYYDVPMPACYPNASAAYKDIVDGTNTY